MNVLQILDWVAIILAMVTLPLSLVALYALYQGLMHEPDYGAAPGQERTAPADPLLREMESFAKERKRKRQKEKAPEVPPDIAAREALKAELLARNPDHIIIDDALIDHAVVWYI